VVSLGELVRQLGSGRIRPNTAAVTVDDGHEDFFTLAVPVLRAYDIAASIFVVSDFIDGRLWLWTDHLRFILAQAPRRPITFTWRGITRVLDIRGDAARRRLAYQWCEHAKMTTAAEARELVDGLADACGVDVPAAPPPEYRPMSMAQVRVLASEGFDIGAHTRTHPILSWLAPHELSAEIGGCKEQLEAALRSPVPHFAYPNGSRRDYTAETIAAVARAGFRAAVTTIPGANSIATPTYELRRIAGDDEDVAHFAQSVSGFQRLRSSTRRQLGAMLKPKLGHTSYEPTPLNGGS
jgi:peptidoglycan/xylan/chitin deacetylase (PgdA/CDA1 family)